MIKGIKITMKKVFKPQKNKKWSYGFIHHFSSDKPEQL